LEFLQWNDPNGAWTDELSKATGMPRATKVEALDAIKQTMKESASSQRSNPAPTEGMLMGKLEELEVRVNGRTKKVRPRGQYLGYIPSSKSLVVLFGTTKKAGGVSEGVKKLHQTFHNAGPTKCRVYEWPDPKGAKKDVGRIVALTYSIPSGMKSPDKKSYRWHHEFGDHGERGHGPVRGSGRYPERLMPVLQQDSQGNLYIKRMPGNKFYVTDWLYW
jgi:hypothetical protein